mgnify:CR=1 FL=1
MPLVCLHRFPTEGNLGSYRLADRLLQKGRACAGATWSSSPAPGKACPRSPAPAALNALTGAVMLAMKKGLFVFRRVELLRGYVYYCWL